MAAIAVQVSQLKQVVEAIARRVPGAATIDESDPAILAGLGRATLSMMDDGIINPENVIKWLESRPPPHIPTLTPSKEPPGVLSVLEDTRQQIQKAIAALDDSAETYIASGRLFEQLRELDEYRTGDNEHLRYIFTKLGHMTLDVPHQAVTRQMLEQLDAVVEQLATKPVGYDEATRLNQMLLDAGWETIPALPSGDELQAILQQIVQTDWSEW
jgi:hypothetical protein